MPKGPESGSAVDEASARRARLLLRAAAALFALFCLNVLLGKAQIVFAFDLGLQLSDVPEFLLLLLSVICFMLATLAREKALGSRDSGGTG